VRFLLVGLVAGVVSGLLGVGGGIVIVPMLVLVGGLSQHHAHATSLAAVIPIAAVGAATYALDDSVHLGIGAALALGAIFGAPLGARFMARFSEASLKITFGFLLIALGAFLVWR
jgi:uncharacterized membrane protein YfcA